MGRRERRGRFRHQGCPQQPHCQLTPLAQWQQGQALDEAVVGQVEKLQATGEVLALQGHRGGRAGLPRTVLRGSRDEK